MTQPLSEGQGAKITHTETTEVTENTENERQTGQPDGETDSDD